MPGFRGAQREPPRKRTRSACWSQFRPQRSTTRAGNLLHEFGHICTESVEERYASTAAPMSSAISSSAVADVRRVGRKVDR